MMFFVPWIVAAVAAGVAATSDVRTRRIPNLLTGPVLLAALVWGACTGQLVSAIAGAAIAGIPYVLLWVVGGGGAGDAKLMLGLGAWVGMAAALPLLLAVALVGGVVSVAYSLANRTQSRISSNLGVLLMSLPLAFAGTMGGARRLSSVVDQRERVPYGLAIFGGVCAAFAWVMLWPS